jgi:ATP-dependent protease HslVU (ClpYQ) peptidase subunit
VTTILAIQGDGWAAIGSDTQWTDDYNRVGRMNQSKVITTGKYLIGVAGDTRGANVVQHSFNPPALPPKVTGAKLTKFIVSQFVPSYKEALESQGAGRPQYDDQPAQSANEILVVANGVIFQIDQDYGTETDTCNLYAIGSGAHYGLGALQAVTEKKKITVATVRPLMLKALTIAAKFDAGTGSPFHMFIQQAQSK